VPEAHLDAGPAWERLTHDLPGRWRAKTPRGSTVDVSYALVSNGSALVETYGVGGSHETVTVFFRDHGDLWLTHYCAQGNVPRLRAVTAAPDDVLLRFVDATNVSPDQGVMTERRLHLSGSAFDLTETYRQPSGPPEVTTLHFERGPQFADWAAVREALVLAHDSDQEGRQEVGTVMVDAQSRGVEPDPERLKAIWKRIGEEDAKNLAMLDVIVRELGWPAKSQVGREGALTAFLIVQHAPHDKQLVYLPMLRDAAAHGEADPSTLALLEDRVNLAEGKKQVYGSQVSTKSWGPRAAPPMSRS
jgi:hypothetical protein